MVSLRNGSLLANALLVVTGAFAGAGITMLISPAVRQDQPSASTGWAGAPRSGNLLGGPSAAADAAFRAAPAASANGKSSADSLAQALQTGDRQDRSAALRKAGAEAASKDVKSALEQANQLKSSQDKLDYMRGVFGVWSKEDPRSALGYAMSSIEPGTLRSETVGVAVNKWGSTDPRAAWLWSEQNLSGPLKEQALSDLVVGWTRNNPEAATQWLASTGMNSKPLLIAAATTMSETDPLGAYKWANSLPSTELRPEIKGATIPAIVQQLPADQIGPLLTPDMGTPEGPELAAILANIWGTTDPKATAAFLKTLPDGAARREGAATLATVWASSDIQGAVAWAATLTDPEMRRQVIAHIGTTWGAIEPDKALDWLATLPAAETGSGVIGAYNSWAAVDPTGLGDWIKTQPQTAAMDQARMSLADVLSATDINASLDLAFAISTPTGRDSAVGRYFHQWRKTDDDSAQEWLRQNWASFPLSMQQRLAKEQSRTVIFR